MTAPDAYDPSQDFFEDVTFTMNPTWHERRAAARRRFWILMALLAFWAASFGAGYALVYGNPFSTQQEEER